MNNILNESYGTPALISSVRHNINDYLCISLENAGCSKIVPSHGGILFQLFTNNGLTMSQMAKKIKRDPSTVTTLVNKLKRYGYVELIGNKDDLRSKLIVLTDKGNNMKDDFFDISNKMISLIFTDIDVDKQRIFIDVLRKINSNLEDATK